MGAPHGQHWQAVYCPRISSGRLRYFSH